MTDDELTFDDLMKAYNSIMGETLSKWVIPMSLEEEAHYVKHPPSEEEIEQLIRKRGAIEVTGHSIRRMRLSDKMRRMLMNTEEFKVCQKIHPPSP